MTEWYLDLNNPRRVLGYDTKIIRHELLREEQGPYLTDYLAHNLRGGPPPKSLKEYGICFIHLPERPLLPHTMD